MSMMLGRRADALRRHDDDMRLDGRKRHLHHRVRYAERRAWRREWSV